MNTVIRVGDIVQLKSGGPKMTVQRIIGSDKSNFGTKAADEFLKMKGFDDGDVICQWFEGNRLNDGTFKAETLISTGVSGNTTF
jgi:uncharacterized protein YodC (DUF2158 family)